MLIFFIAKEKCHNGWKTRMQPLKKSATLWNTSGSRTLSRRTSTFTAKSMFYPSWKSTICGKCIFSMKSGVNWYRERSLYGGFLNNAENFRWTLKSFWTCIRILMPLYLKIFELSMKRIWNGLIILQLLKSSKTWWYVSIKKWFQEFCFRFEIFNFCVFQFL